MNQPRANADDSNATPPNADGPNSNTPNSNTPSTNTPSATGQDQPATKADPHPAWVVGTYENPGKIDDNILSGEKSITFAADGTYTGFYCKSCGDQPGKWAVNDGKLVLEGGNFAGTITLATDLTSNCRILDYMNQQFYRHNVVPGCPLGGERADVQACSFVGTYQSTGTGNVSDSILVSIEPDYFWYYEKTHMYCVTNQFGSKCLNTTNYEFGTWSVVDGSLSGVPLSGLTFTRADCTSFGAAGDGSAGASSGGGSSGGGSSGGSAGASNAGGSGGTSGGGTAPDAGAGASSAGGSGGTSGGGTSAGGRAGASSAGGNSGGGSSGGGSSGGGSSGASTGGSGGASGGGSSGGSAAGPDAGAGASSAGGSGGASGSSGKSPSSGGSSASP